MCVCVGFFSFCHRNEGVWLEYAAECQKGLINHFCWDCIRHFPIQRWAVVVRWNKTWGFAVRPAGLHSISTCYAPLCFLCRVFPSTGTVIFMYRWRPALPCVNSTRILLILILLFLNSSKFLLLSSVVWTVQKSIVLWAEHLKHAAILQTWTLNIYYNNIQFTSRGGCPLPYMQNMCVLCCDVQQCR